MTEARSTYRFPVTDDFIRLCSPPAAMDATELVTLVGSISATLTTAAFLPQVVRVWRLKDARDISFVTFSVFGLGLVGWVVYGVLTSSIPVVVANALTLVLALTILALKVKFDRIESSRSVHGT